VRAVGYSFECFGEKIMGAGMTGHERPNKGDTDEWWTPLEIVRALGEFDLDPCGNKTHHTAKKILDITDNGMLHEWSGLVWLNPPYSDVGRWMERLSTHNYGTALIFARTETKWFQKIIGNAESLFFPNTRLKFLKNGGAPKGNAGASSVFISYGHKPDWNKLPFGGFEARIVK
jgi:hypothetical protein